MDVFTDSFGLIMNFRNYNANNFPLSASSSSSKLKERGILAEIGGRGQVELKFLDENSEPFDLRVQRLVSERDAARVRKDFGESDRIRDELDKMGVVLKDGKDADGKPKTTWEIAR
jgi:cysteinyl-tRNA synthetase